MKRRKNRAKHKEGKCSCKSKQRKMHQSHEMTGDKDGVRSSEKGYTSEGVPLPVA